MRLLIAVDAGGTKTALLVREQQRPTPLEQTWLGPPRLERTFGGAYLPQVGPDSVQEVFGNILRALEPQLHAAQEAFAVFGLPGYGENPEWTSGYDALVQQSFAGLSYRLYNDVRLALEGALGGHPGLVALSGTGSMVLGKAADGQLYRVGGWGPLFGDEGSSYAIGRQGLRAAAQAQDGRAAATILSSAAPLHFGVSSLGGVTALLQHSGQQRAQVASLARTVNRCAEQGDPVSRLILERAADDLAAQIKALRFRLGSGLPVAWTGGTFGSAIFHGALSTRLLQAGIELIAAQGPPTEGGILLARALADDSGCGGPEAGP